MFFICRYETGSLVSGYPNYFKVNGPNTSTGHSSQISYDVDAIDAAYCGDLPSANSFKRFEPKHEKPVAD
jgi:hypothetical protein